MFGLKRKLKACRHINTGVYTYVRDSGGIENLVYAESYKVRETIKQNMSGLRTCLDCGSTQRFNRCDPLALNGGKEPWLAPWLWRA